ncbi:hypothetical protein MTO96_012532 [Rhipicephalus appendiculatus]
MVSPAVNRRATARRRGHTVLVLSAIVAGTMFGNVLALLAIFTNRPFRSVQNMFIVSLAVADITEALLVRPLNVP